MSLTQIRSLSCVLFSPCVHPKVTFYCQFNFNSHYILIDTQFVSPCNSNHIAVLFSNDRVLGCYQVLEDIGILFSTVVLTISDRWNVVETGHYRANFLIGDVQIY